MAWPFGLQEMYLNIFWGDATLTIASLIDTMPSKTLNFHTLIVILKSHFPHITGLGFLSPKVFGCSVYVHVPSKDRSKFDLRAIKCIFIGNSPTKKG